MAVKVASSIFVNQFNATKLVSSKTQFQFELSLAQLSPSLLSCTSSVTIYRALKYFYQIIIIASSFLQRVSVSTKYLV